MRVPFSWIKEYVAWHGTVEELAEVLTMSGTEVEGIDWVGAPRDPENLSRFVVGKVLTKEQHPNADKLSLCTVEVGQANGGVRQIVCGASNFAAGDTVAVSLSGAVLENGLKLKKANLRGVESDGMMMSEQELGYEDKSPGIAVLPDEWIVGAPLQDYLPVSEAVLELELTSNRPDCFSIYGIAREVAAAARLELAPPPIAAPAAFGGAPVAESIAVEIADPDLCPRYVASVIRGVTIGESPAWLKARLTHAGMRPINNVVDVTNYVMLGWGQPLHAFDAGKIRGGKLIARRAAAGEKIVTLDGVERTLDDQMLVIADVDRPLVIAGVFGSVDAEIDEHTTDIVLEAANFAGPSILRTELHTGIRSEASNRFEKGIDPNLAPGGLDFADRLFAELCGGTVAPGMVDAGGVPPAPAALSYRPARTEALLGYAVPAPEQAGILRRLECEVDEAGDAWSVLPPTFRPDLIREVDLVEEVGRIAGYGLAPETLPRHTTAGRLTQVQKVRRAIRRALAGCGLDEAITYTFIAPDALAPLGLPDGDPRLEPVRISNPMSVEQSVMRTMLLPGLLGAVRDNLDRLNEPPNLFEIGKVYLWDEPVAGAGARRRARRHAAARAGGARHRALRAARAGELDRRGPGDRLLHAQGRRGHGAGCRAPARRVRAARRRRGALPVPAPRQGRAREPCPAPAGWARSGSSARTWPPPSASTTRPCTSRRSTWTASLRQRSRRRRSRTSARIRRPRRTSPSWSAGTCRRRRSWSRPAAPAASSSAACASSTCTRATRCRRTSARWRCASSCARPSAR